MKTLYIVYLSLLIILVVISIYFIYAYNTQTVTVPIVTTGTVTVPSATTETATVPIVTTETINIPKITTIPKITNIWVNEHNKIRKQVPGVDTLLPVAWNDDIAKGAQEYANQCKFEHSTQASRTFGKNILGENLGMGSPSSMYNETKMVNMWDSEKKLYMYPNPPDSNTGHYTQIINKNVSEIGCGCNDCNNSHNSSNNNNNDKLCVCRYNPIQIGNQSPY
jgi:uncharacterized protein YkwD